MVSKLFDLSGKTALITGASKGLGRASAEALASAGANIIITARNREELEKAKEDISKISNVKIRTYVVDHSDWKNAQSFADTVLEDNQGVDILVNNAGTGLLARIEDMKDEEWEYIMSLNISNYMALCRAFVPRMKSKGWGRIINIASLFGVTALENRTAYCASKGAVISFTRALAIELAPHSITVNSISCGPMRTPLMTQSWNNPAKRKYFSDLVPLGRWGEPEDIYGIILLLASQAGNYITGQNISREVKHM